MEMHIFGYQIGTVNMDRCQSWIPDIQGSQFFRPQKTFIVNEKN